MMQRDERKVRKSDEMREGERGFREDSAVGVEKLGKSLMIVALFDLHSCYQQGRSTVLQLTAKSSSYAHESKRNRESGEQQNRKSRGGVYPALLHGIQDIHILDNA